LGQICLEKTEEEPLAEEDCREVDNYAIKTFTDLNWKAVRKGNFRRGGYQPQAGLGL